MLGTQSRSRLSAMKRDLKEWAAHGIFLASALFGILMLALLLAILLRDGAGGLHWGFITNLPSRFPDMSGIKVALLGTLWVMAFTALFSFPLGVGTALYLEEYAPKNWVTRVLQVNISNLAGVPSVVYGILGLALFVRFLSLDRSVLSGALTMSLLILPIVIVTSQEAIKSVPNDYKQASYALGASRWQTIWYVVLPRAFPFILTGTILAMSRAIGETAPLLIIGAFGYLNFSPASPTDPFTVLPIQLFNWTSRPQDEFRDIAASAIIVLLLVLLTMNAGAIFLRAKFRGGPEE